MTSLAAAGCSEGCAGIVMLYVSLSLSMLISSPLSCQLSVVAIFDIVSLRISISSAAGGAGCESATEDATEAEDAMIPPSAVIFVTFRKGPDREEVAAVPLFELCAKNPLLKALFTADSPRARKDDFLPSAEADEVGVDSVSISLGGPGAVAAGVVVEVVLRLP